MRARERWLPRRLIGPMASLVDRAVTAAVSAGSTERQRPGRRPSRAEILEYAQRYAAAPVFFRGARPIDPSGVPAVALAPGLAGIDFSWPSRYEPLLPEARGLFERYPANQRAAARLYTRAAPRPVAILIHGYLGGAFAFEQRVWPIRWLDRLGFDVALFTLPFHGVRAVGGFGARPFPGRTPLTTNEGFRQAIGDLSDFIGWLGERGHGAVGLMGMSLGGYAAALMATVRADLAFLIPIVPLACLADFAREQGRLAKHLDHAARQHRALAQAYATVSPLERPSLIARERVLVLGARADRITPLRHAERLAAHFRCSLEVFEGGHLLQVGRAAAFQRVRRLLQSLALV